MPLIQLNRHDAYDTHVSAMPSDPSTLWRKRSSFNIR